MFRSTTLLWVAMCGIVLLDSAPFSPPAAAQSRIQLSKNSPDVQRSLSELVAPLVPSVVDVFDNSRLCQLGTIVSTDGLIVTKSSEIKDKPSLICKLHDGRQFQPTVIAESEPLDLSLLKIEATELAAVDLSSSPTPTAGSFVISVGENASPLGFGVVEADPRTFRIRQRPTNEHGYLGVQAHLDGKSRKLLVDYVSDDSPAQRAGIRVGDELRSVNGVDMDQRDQLFRELRKHKSGEQIELVVVRNALEMTVQPKLVAYPHRDPSDQWGGGPFSIRRFGFDDIIVHDTVIQPSQCGGPLVDTDGRVVGINIARSLRVASYSLPAAVVAEFVEQHRPTTTASDSAPCAFPLQRITAAPLRRVEA